MSTFGTSVCCLVLGNGHGQHIHHLFLHQPHWDIDNLHDQLLQLVIQGDTLFLNQAGTGDVASSVICSLGTSSEGCSMWASLCPWMAPCGRRSSTGPGRFPAASASSSTIEKYCAPAASGGAHGTWMSAVQGRTERNDPPPL